MNPAKGDALDYIPFPVAAQRSFAGQEAARCQRRRRPPRPTTPLPVCYGGSRPTRRLLGQKPGIRRGWTPRSWYWTIERRDPLVSGQERPPPGILAELPG